MILQGILNNTVAQHFYFEDDSKLPGLSEGRGFQLVTTASKKLLKSTSIVMKQISMTHKEK